MNVLLVEDDALLQSGIREALRRDGWQCDASASAYEAQVWFDAADYALVLLDLGLPDGSGLDLLKDWRKRQRSVPVIILTARDEVQDRVDGLDAGADDYLVKPFAISELLARMRSVLRRSEGHSDNIVRSGGLSMDLAQRSVSWQGENLRLVGREYALLNRLLLRIDQVVAREVLLNDWYSWSDALGSNTLEVYVHRLRKQLPKDAIETVRGQGYRLCSAALQGADA